jgi:hypothetical protein
MLNFLPNPNLLPTINPLSPVFIMRSEASRADPIEIP